MEKEILKKLGIKIGHYTNIDGLTGATVIIPDNGAVIYDRRIGKDIRHHLKDGFEMAKNASYTNLEQGNVGVGTGATAGKWIYKNRIKGGFGISIKEISDNAYVGAFVVTNAVGDVINPDTKDFYSNCGK